MQPSRRKGDGALAARRRRRGSVSRSALCGRGGASQRVATNFGPAYPHTRGRVATNIGPPEIRGPDVPDRGATSRVPWTTSDPVTSKASSSSEPRYDHPTKTSFFRWIRTEEADEALNLSRGSPHRFSGRRRRLVTRLLHDVCMGTARHKSLRLQHRRKGNLSQVLGMMPTWRRPMPIYSVYNLIGRKTCRG